jgi:hypothetical protein
MRRKILRHLGLLFDETKQMTKLLSLEGAKAKLTLPVEFTPHRYAVFLLHIAAEIEHALMVQYLYAAFSLGGSKVPQDRWIEVSGWREIILGIAKEEMGHLMTVQNVLRCLGGPLNLDREDFPWDSKFYPFPFKLEPLTRQSLAKYVFSESPVDWSGPEAEEVRELAQQGASGTAPINHVGKLYKTIEDLLIDKTPLLKDTDFRGSTFPYQANWDEWGRGYKGGARGNSTKEAMAGTPDVLLLPVVARTDSVAALKKIAEQGEANSKADDTAPSHFARFLRILRKFPKDRWSPSRPVPVDPIVLSEGQDGGGRDDWGGTPITHPESKLWAHLFNIRYEALLKCLLHTFEYPNNTSDVSQTTPRGLLLHSTFGEMYNIHALSEILVQMPLAPGSSLMAGPPFQIPYTLKLPVDAAERWRAHLDLLQTSGALIDRLLDCDGQRHAAYLRTVRGADLQLIATIERILGRPPVAAPAIKQYS